MNSGQKQLNDMLQASLEDFEAVDHKKAMTVILNDLAKLNPNNRDLSMRLFNSDKDLDDYIVLHTLHRSCYRKRSATSNERLSILCELAIPSKDGYELKLFKD